MLGLLGGWRRRRQHEMMPSGPFTASTHRATYRAVDRRNGRRGLLLQMRQHTPEAIASPFILARNQPDQFLN